MTQEMEQGSSATLVAVRNGPGARLRAAREANGFTQLEVAQQLRLNPDIIGRLEEDNYDLTTPLVFVKGYLKSYAALIGLDPEQIIIEFGHLGIKDPVREVPDLGHAQQRKLSNFDAGTPRHRPGLLWGSLAIFACAMLAFMFAYRDQLPVLNAPQAAATATTTTPSTEEAELNAAIEAARQANAPQTMAPANTPGGAAVPVTPASTATATPASTAPAAATASTPAANASASAAPAATASTPAPLKKEDTSRAGNSNDDSGDDEETQVKPVSANRTVVPAKRSSVKQTHETMLF